MSAPTSTIRGTASHVPVVAEFNELLTSLEQATAEQCAEPTEWDEFRIDRIDGNTGHPLRSVIGSGVPFLFASKSGPRPASPDSDQRGPPPDSGTSADRGDIPEIAKLCSTLTAIESVVPVRTDQARYLLSLYMLGGNIEQTEPDNSAVLPLFVACSDGESQVLGMWRRENQIVSFNLPVMGREPVIPSKDQHIRDFSQRYANRWSLPSSAKVQMTASAVYNILGAPECTDLSNLSVYFSWPEPDALFAPPPYSANVFFRARAIPCTTQNNAGPSASWLTSDLGILSTLLGRMDDMTADDTKSPAEIWPAATSGGREALEVDAFLEMMQRDVGKPQVSVKDTKPNGICQRNDLDFTDRLWEFCKEANGYLELRNALGLVFRGLQNGSLQPMIHRTNKSMIAEVARRCLPVVGQSGEDAGPSVREMLQKFADPEKLLSAVVEIGVTKLRRDFVAHFIGEEICSRAQLGPFVENHGTTISEQADRLRRLHNVLELTTNGKAYAELPHGSLRQLMKDGLDYYREHDSRSIPFFGLNLPAFSEAASKLKRICAAMEPAKWNVTFGSEGRAGDKMTAAYSVNRDSLGLSVDGDDGATEGLHLSPDVSATAYHRSLYESRAIIVG